MTTHKIKLSHCFFDDVASGRKNFELRKNDRHYQVGDCLCLCEVKEKRLTGRKLMVAVTFINYKILLDYQMVIAF